MGTEVQLIPAEGISVVSDIDYTIKHSHVLNRQELLRNTFTRRYQAVDGMAALYREWSRTGAAFHYVSASPWALFGPLHGLLRESGFPTGSLHLRMLRIKDSSALRFFLGSRGFKAAAISEILADFPGRRFILVGDSGENDPEIYAELAKAHPRQVMKILIREVFAAGAEPLARYRDTFKGLPPGSWQVFRNASEIQLRLLPSG